VDQIPAFLLSLGVAAAVAACVQSGIRLAQRNLGRRPDLQAHDGVGAIVGALLGLLAFLLAFAFGMAADRRAARKDLLLTEVNSIGTTWLRTDLIPEPHRSASRALLRRYVDLHLEGAEHPDSVSASSAEATQIQSELWTHAAALAEADLKNPDIVALYFNALNKTIDLQTSRLTVSSYRIPGVVWTTFAVLTVLSSLAVGYNFGQKSGQPQLLMTAMLSISLATVLFLIFDLDRGNRGWLKVDQGPMYDLREQIAAPTGSTAG